MYDEVVNTITSKTETTMIMFKKKHNFTDHSIKKQSHNMHILMLCLLSLVLTSCFKPATESSTGSGLNTAGIMDASQDSSNTPRKNHIYEKYASNYNEVNAKKTYMEQCDACHAIDGTGISPLKNCSNCNNFDALFIATHDRMPQRDTGRCRNQCAYDTSRVIYEIMNSNNINKDSDANEKTTKPEKNIDQKTITYTPVAINEFDQYEKPTLNKDKKEARDQEKIRKETIANLKKQISADQKNSDKERQKQETLANLKKQISTNLILNIPEQNTPLSIKEMKLDLQKTKEQTAEIKKVIDDNSFGPVDSTTTVKMDLQPTKEQTNDIKKVINNNSFGPIDPTSAENIELDNKTNEFDEQILEQVEDPSDEQVLSEIILKDTVESKEIDSEEIPTLNSSIKRDNEIASTNKRIQNAANILWTLLTKKEDYTDWGPFPGNTKDIRPGTQPHGEFVRVLANNKARMFPYELPHESIIVKENYDIDAQTLKAITVMLKTKSFNKEYGNWFWAKYTPEGKLAVTEDGNPIAGKVEGCIQCHTQAKGKDYSFANDL